MALPSPPFIKVCAWCEAPFLAMHSKINCCCATCRQKHARRRQRKWWRKFYRKNHERLSAYYRAYHAANKQARNIRQREHQRRRLAAMTEAEYLQFREQRREYEKSRRLVCKVQHHWRCSAAEARSMIQSGSFPP